MKTDDGEDGECNNNKWSIFTLPVTPPPNSDKIPTYVKHQFRKIALEMCNGDKTCTGFTFSKKTIGEYKEGYIFHHDIVNKPTKATPNSLCYRRNVHKI